MVDIQKFFTIYCKTVYQYDISFFVFLLMNLTTRVLTLRARFFFSTVNFVDTINVQSNANLSIYLAYLLFLLV